jgi:Mrp family chromosome partitioning ATPase
VGEPYNFAITGIRDPERESFIASTLFNQGWSITMRALDFPDILKLCEDNLDYKPTIILATDLEGLTPAGIAQLQNCGFPLFLFTSEKLEDSDFLGAQAFPETELELSALMRGSLRVPLIQTSKANLVIRAKIIAVASGANAAGCTTFVINLATELSALGKKCLLVDAHAFAPAIASLLSARGLRDCCTQISENLWAMEISQNTLERDISQLQRARSEFDFIVIDLGAVRQLGVQLTSKRWESEAINWCSNYADQLWILSRSDQLSLERLRELLKELSHNAVKPTVTCVHNMRNVGKKNSPLDQSFSQSTQILKNASLVTLPLDERSTFRAESEHTTLVEVNERSHLRRAIAEIAGRMGS